jgi:hypothetical protein
VRRIVARGHPAPAVTNVAALLAVPILLCHWRSESAAAGFYTAAVVVVDSPKFALLSSSVVKGVRIRVEIEETRHIHRVVPEIADGEVRRVCTASEKMCHVMRGRAAGGAKIRSRAP